MTELPPPLKPWAPLLARFPLELAVELGAWVERLSLAIGPFRSDGGVDGDEPQGFDGLTRRGLYERLLPSEWLLADEVPLEFDRRAAMGEHAFFRLSRKQPKGSKRCVALLDAGPSQLGTPRLMHLAALIVLSRRATEGGADFAWGVLQDAQPAPLLGLGEGAVQHWLGGRTGHSPSDAHLQAWSKVLGGLPPKDELWLIGGAKATALRPGACTLEVKDPYRPGARVLRTELRLPSRQANLELQLPSNEVCTRLLREPLGPKVVAPKTVNAPAKGLRFLAASQRLVWVTRDGSVVCHVVPGRGQNVTPMFTIAPTAGETLVAMGWTRGLVLVTQSRVGHVFVRLYSKRGHLVNGLGPYVMDGPTFDAGLEPGHYHSEWHAAVERQRVITSEGDVVELFPPLVGKVMERDVRVLGTFREQLLFARADGSLGHFGAGFSDAAVQAMGTVPPSALAHLDCSLNPVVALSTQPDVWELRVNGAWKYHTLRDAGSTVHGLYRRSGGTGEAALLVRSKDKASLALESPLQRISVAKADSAIERVELSPDSAHVAWVTATGDLTVYSLKFQQKLLRLVAARGGQ